MSDLRTDEQLTKIRDKALIPAAMISILQTGLFTVCALHAHDAVRATFFIGLSVINGFAAYRIVGSP